MTFIRHFLLFSLVFVALGASPAFAESSGYSGTAPQVAPVKPPEQKTAPPETPQAPEEKKLEAPEEKKQPVRIDTQKIDPCSAYMTSYNAYVVCQDRVMKIQRMKDAREKRNTPPPPPPAPAPAAAEPAAAAKTDANAQVSTPEVRTEVPAAASPAETKGAAPAKSK